MFVLTNQIAANTFKGINKVKIKIYFYLFIIFTENLIIS